MNITVLYCTYLYAIKVVEVKAKPSKVNHCVNKHMTSYIEFDRNRMIIMFVKLFHISSLVRAYFRVLILYAHGCTTKTLQLEVVVKCVSLGGA